MTPFVVVEGTAVHLPMDSVDTDQLIPARFMTRTRAQGYGDALFHDLRHAEDGTLRGEFPLNGVQAPTFLVAGSNFGCGSSREAAVYALADYGIRAVLALGFADIFRSNAMKNGLLPVTLDTEGHVRASKAKRMIVDLDAQVVQLDDGGAPLKFEVPAAARRRILAGLDEITDTLTRLDQIEAQAHSAEAARPWLIPADPET